MKTTKLKLSSQIIRQLNTKELRHVAGGNSVNCSNPGVSLCIQGCTQPPP